MQSVKVFQELSVDDRQESSSDEDIIRQVIAGEKEQYRALMQRYKDMVFSMIMRQVGDRAVTEDLAQETFIKAFHSLKSFRFESSFSTWIIRIALNHTNSYFSSKRYKQNRKTESFDLGIHDTSVDPTNASTSPQDEAAITKFREEFAKLKPRFREIISLCALEGKSYEDCAHILKIPVGTVRSRLHKARALLKEALFPNE